KLQFVALGSPQLIFCTRGGLARLGRDWTFIWRGKPYVVPRGMWTDGASIPRVFMSLIGGRLDPLVVVAALPHDLSYETGLFDRLEADLLFLHALLWVLFRRMDDKRAQGKWLSWAWLGAARLPASVLMALTVMLFGWLVWCRQPGR